MKIHGVVFLIIGGVVLGVSLFKDQLRFFTYVGGLFILYGTFKIIFKVITGSSSEKEALRIRQQQIQSLQGQPKQQQNQYRTQTFKCQRCGNDVFPQNNFCSSCGIRYR